MSIRGAWAKVSTDTPLCGFYAYGSVINEESGDPFTIAAQPLPPVEGMGR